MTAAPTIAVRHELQCYR